MKLITIVLCSILFSTASYCKLSSDSSNVAENSSIGIFLGLPGAMNISYSKNLDDFELLFTAGAWPSGVYGVQTSIDKDFLKLGNIHNAVTFSAGLSHHWSMDPSKSIWAGIISKGLPEPGKNVLSFYSGPGYAFKWNWFTFRLNLFIGNNDFDVFRLIAQMNFRIYRF